MTDATQTMSFDAQKTAKPSPRARKTAKQESEGRRRRRSDDITMTGKLGIDVTKLDPAYEYRWLNNTPERIAAKTKQDDWDLVDNSDETHASTGEDSHVRRPSGEAGMVLVRKPKKYFEDDKAAKIAAVMETDNQVKGGRASNELGADGYVPTGGISVK